MKEYAYHCTNIDPKTILTNGFKATGNGYTDTNLVQHFYDEFLPKDPMFLSGLKVKVWDPKSEWCFKVDVSGLKKYPDFGHLLDYGAYFDERSFWWAETEHQLKAWLSSPDEVQRRLADFILNELDDGILWANDFDGETSYKVLGTFAIDGAQFNASRLVEAKHR